MVNLELFNRVFEYSQMIIGYDTYDSLPMNDVDYPFIVLDNMENIPQNLKTNLSGRTTITVHVWGNNDMRYEVAKALDNFLNLREFESDNFKFETRFNDSTTQILNDTSVANTVLIHGIATLVFDWFRK
jgi:predicted component of type VI protein secretion system